MPGTLPTNWLDPVNWGLSSSGAPGLAETVNTLGLDRLDTRVPPDQYRIGGLQISQCKNLLISISAFMKGGTRLQCLYQTSNPFGTSEFGWWVDASGNPRFSTGGVAYQQLTQLWPVKTVTGASYAASTTDFWIDVNFAGAVALTLPTAPVGGTTFFLKDASGAAATNNITINAGSGDSIEGSSSTVIKVNYGFRAFLYNATTHNWEVFATSSPVVTLAQAYANGGAGPQVFGLDATRLGVIIRDNATPIGQTLLGVQNSAGTTKFLDVTAGQITFKSGIAAGSTRPFVFDTVSAFGNGQPTFSLAVQGTEYLSIEDNSSGAIIHGQSGTEIRLGGNLALRGNAGAILPSDGAGGYINNNQQLGNGTYNFSAIYAYSHIGVVQTLSGSGAIANFNATSGETIVFTATGNVTSLGMIVGNTGQRATLILRQGSSAYTWPTTIANVKFPGGTFTKTSMANSVDRVDLACDGTAWYALAVAANLS
ncbi:MAG TPA: hypothetical protein VJ891_15420 [Casimicrobiaceae bacterium]|nr:hypothetical protein [Casimicrobiaceae bacterium]